MSNQQGSQKGVIALIITLGTLAGALVGVFALLKVFGVEPPKLVTEPTPTSVQLSGGLSNVSLEHNVRFGEFMTLRNMNTEGYREEDLQLFGAIVHFNADITGFKGKTVYHKWQVYNADTDTRVIYSNEYFETGMMLETEIDNYSDFIWVQYPFVNGNYYARVELYNPNGVRLNYINTEPFPLYWPP